jgi:hypothetical protein
MHAPDRLPARPPAAHSHATYSLAHEKRPRRRISGTQRVSAAHFVAAPIHFTRPEKGVQHLAVTCPACRERVTVLVRSPGAVRLERVKRGLYVVLTVLVFYGLVVLIPWEGLVGSNDACVGVPALFAFGILAFYNAGQAIASETALLVDLPRKPLLDILPALAGRREHTIQRQ